MEELCRDLTRRELLVQNVDPRSAERGQVAFVQALIREVAYGTLSRRDRRSRHLAAARFFESLGEDELAGALASHYLAAYRAAPDDPDSRPLAAQAKIALRAAASRAGSLGSHDQAVRFLVEAIEVTDDPAEIAELLERAGNAAVLGGDVGKAEPLLRDAITRRAEMGDRSGAARATALLGKGFVNDWRAADAIALLEPAVEAYGDLADDPALASIEHQLARGYWFGDDTVRAIELADRAIGRAERIEAVELIADALITKGGLLDASRPYEGIGILEAGIRLAETLGLRETVARGLLNLGVAFFGRDPRSAFEHSKAALDLGSRFGFRSSYATAVGNAAELAVDLGEWDWALAATDDTNVGHLAPADRASVFRPRAEILAGRGEPVDDLLAEHERLIAERNDAQQESNLLAGRAAAAFAAGRYREAAAAWRRSAEMNPTNAATDFTRVPLERSLWEGDLDGVEAAPPSAGAPPVARSRRRPGAAGDARGARRARRRSRSTRRGSTPRSSPSWPRWASPTSRRSWSSTWRSCSGQTTPSSRPTSTTRARSSSASAREPFSARLDELMGEAADARSSAVRRLRRRRSRRRHPAGLP